VVSFTPWPFYPRYLLLRRLNGFQSLIERGALQNQGIKVRAFCFVPVVSTDFGSPESILLFFPSNFFPNSRYFREIKTINFLPQSSLIKNHLVCLKASEK